MRLTAGLDSGPVCLRRRGADRARGRLRRARRAPAGARCAAADRRARGAIRRSPSSPRRASPTPRRSRPPTGCSTPPVRRVELERAVRALHPHIGARLQLGGRSLLGVRRAAPARGRRPGVETLAGVAGARRPAVAVLLARRARAARGPAAGGAGDGGRRLPTRSRGARAPVGAQIGRAAGSRDRAGRRVRACRRRSRAAARRPKPLAPGRARRRSVRRCGPWPKPPRSGSQHRGGRELLVVRLAHLPPAAGDDVLDDRLQGASTFSPRSVDRARLPEQHHGAVVGGVVHRRARQHEAVDQRHRQARRGPRRHRPASCAGAQRAVAVDDPAVARVQGGDHERLPVRR